MSIPVINHAALAKERLATQFKEATNLINYIISLLTEADELETVFQDLCNKRWIDTAVGVQLDILGEIVGQERGFKQEVAEVFFGFKGAIGSGTFGTIGTSTTGSNFKSLSDIEFVDTLFDDDTYRVFIRAKAKKNHTKSRRQDVIDIVLLGVTSVTTLTVTEGKTTFKLTFNGSLSDSDKLLLARTTFVPRPAGVSATFADDDGIFS